MFKIYKNLSPNHRLALGIGCLAWGAAGLYLADGTAQVFGIGTETTIGIKDTAKEDTAKESTAKEDSRSTKK